MAYEGMMNPVMQDQARCVANCMGCGAQPQCLIARSRITDVQHWNGLVQSQQNLASGKALFEAGAPASSVYSVRAGCVKTFTIDADGHERVLGFHLPGDIIGLEAFGQSQYNMHAVALTPSQVCAIPRASMTEVVAGSAELLHRLVERLSHSLRAALTLAGDYTADQRVASFLLEMQRRLSPLPGKPMRLPMSRRDIANYLRLATETVCRVLTRFEQQGLVKVEERRIDILAPAELQRSASSGV
jgi:CRP/FNR family transcriptional regulator